MIEWAKYVYYDEDSPSCLRWLYDRGNQTKAGDSVGSLNKGLGYWQFSLSIAGKQKTYYCHRVVWELHNGPVGLGLQIDHVDINRKNNRIGNLRTVPKKKNLRNASMQSRNKSGITGVFRIEGYWVASWMKLNGKEQQKRFSISKLGEESAKQAAVDERLNQIKILNDMGAGYTHQHGKQQRKENEN